jgi:Zn-dependent peptidase ImmA (M78 family)
MLFEQIIEKSRGLVKKYQTRDPKKLASELHLQVRYDKGFGKLKGLYLTHNRNRFVYLNGNLDEKTARIVLAHEIGHDTLHRELAKSKAFREFTLYQMDTRPEYEANLFAAEILIDTDKILELINRELDVEQIAKLLEIDVNLIAIKVSSLIKQGYNLRVQEFRSDFLK